MEVLSHFRLRGGTSL
uniref:Uncharacterized protein n=1 Tax=Anguilla anguilla TaxID=7936 RepID=A0A0E9QEJ4_ANGAN